MSAPIISFTHEIDVLTETENAIKTTFQQCREMIKDVLEYNSGIKVFYYILISISVTDYDNKSNFYALVKHILLNTYTKSFFFLIGTVCV